MTLQAEPTAFAPPPPPPHDPTERHLVMMCGEWEVRVFGANEMHYFRTRGLWHLQLWHPRAQVSVLSASRLTLGLYECFPFAGWKGRARTDRNIAAMVKAEHGIDMPSAIEMARLEKALVDDVVRAATELAS